eukprot:TRINITY_DN16283_c0_g1_i5.p1 TRINITY_DN16283_c0_g1~~TRINITY_DN16283_c0_g1_i5.p1  ORF type:complete len:131 (+),score=23.10 TRINITY_DN16283_c0_g1_i5:234-626(+)
MSAVPIMASMAAAALTDGSETVVKPAPSKVRKNVQHLRKAGNLMVRWSTWGLKKAGNLGWAVGTSMMILVVPVVLDIIRDQELTDHMIQQEALEQFQKQQSATVVGGAPPSGMGIPGMPAPPPMSETPAK